jgi:antitoxin StbD
MAPSIGALAVHPVTEARNDFSRVVARFREEGLMAEPVIYGSHRKPEAVTIPYEMFERLLPAMEEILLAEMVRERLSEPVIEWSEALVRMGLSDDEVAATDLDKFVITPNE